MLFNSYSFICFFLPVTLLGFYGLARWSGPTTAKVWLIAASLFYYGWWNPLYLILILGSAIINFYLGMALSNPQRSAIGKKGVLTVGVILNLAVLGYFKYANFFVDTINQVAQVGWNLEKIILPIAISFFTFQQIAFLVDAFRSKARDYNFIDYTLFVVFFPQLIAGPIVHHGEMMPQFSNRRTYRIQAENIAVGFTLFAFGLFKKVVIADNIGADSSAVFNLVAAGGSAGFADAWAGCLAYTFQLYFDFSGYSDMAIGLARLFGIRLPVNFNSPYKSKSIIDFWRRWHITLSRFLKEYLYIPLGGNRCRRPRQYLNLFLTMFLGGLWHGAGWTFIVWGALHGVYLIINHLWVSLKPRLGFSGRSSTGRAAALLLTFLVTMIAWVFFRADNLPTALVFLQTMAGLNPEAPIAHSILKPSVWLSLIILLGIAWYAPNTQEIMRYFRPALNLHNMPKPSPLRRYLVWWPNRRWAIVVGLVFIIAFLSLSRRSEFLYYQF